MFGSKSAAPRAESCIWLPPVLTQTTSKSISLFTSPPGYLVTSNLVDKLLNQGREIFWLRMGPEDRDPGILLFSLVECLQGDNMGIKDAIMADMQRSPGPITGWQPLFNQFTEDVLDVLPSNSVIVFEHMHHLCDQPSTLMLLENSLLSSLSLKFPCILITHQHLPSASFPIHCTLYQPKDLKISSLAGTTLADHAGIDIRPNIIHRLVEITDGRMGALQNILNASLVLGSRYLEKIVKSAKNHRQLFKTLTQELLAGMTLDEQSVLFLSSHLKYCHPDITQALFLKKIYLNHPWGQSLNNAWQRPLCLWLPYLQMGIKMDRPAKHLILRKAADYLVQQSNGLNSLPLYFELEDFEQACRVLVEHSQSMLNLGQWLTLEKWLAELPISSLHNHPTLLYVQGELQTARGDMSVGKKTFSLATQMFSQKDDQSGVCESLLAEGTLAAWEGEIDKAQICFLKADTLAQTNRLKQQQRWISWTRSYFASGEANPGMALAYLEQAVDTTKNPDIKELYDQVKLLLKQQQSIHQQQEELRRVYLNLSQSDYDIEQKLSLLLKTPHKFAKFLGVQGWADLPLISKILTAPPGVDQVAATNGTSSSVVMNLFQNLSDLGQRIKKAFTNGGTANGTLEDNLPQPVASSDLLNQIDLRGVEMGDDTAPRTSYFVEKPYRGVTLFIDQTGKESLSAHLLGSCCISLNDHPLDDQITGRSLAILQYLLFHHTQKQHREVLMSVFWPDAPPDSARNNLNVALHNLRQSFRSVTDLPVIEFHNDAYRFNPNLQIWLDVDEFEHHIQAGLQYKQSANLELAIREYEIGVDLYQADLLLDDPYEEWALAPRERLRIAFLDALGNLSQIYFSQEQYSACIALCQRILERDNCREDTHCLLMRSYNSLGQRSLALRQYQICVDALRSELGVNPEIATEQLAEHIRSLGDI